MLPAEQIKQFLVRLITGYGEPVQPDGGNEKALRETSDKMISTAGTNNTYSLLLFNYLYIDTFIYRLTLSYKPLL